MKGRLTAGVSALLLALAACGPAATATPQSAATPTRAVAAPSAPQATPPSQATATPAPKATATPATTSAGGPKFGGTFVLPQREDPPTWDPVITQLEPGGGTTTLVLSRWMIGYTDPPQDCKLGVSPLVVKDWQWKDASTLTLNIQQGIKFHNKPPVSGRELVADDLVFSFDQFRKYYYYADLAARVAEIKATSKYSLEMKLGTPFGGIFDELLSMRWGPWIMAKEVGGTGSPAWSDPHKSWIGVGPFVFDKWTPGVKWTMVRNPDYFRGPKPYLDGVDIVVMPDASTRMAAMRSGKLSGIYLLHEVGIQELAKAVPGLQVTRCPGMGSGFPGVIYMDHSVPPFNDVRVRRAVAMAIDQKSLIDTLYQGKAVSGRLLVPASPYSLAIEDYPPDVRQYLEYHPDRSKKLLADAGYSKGLDTVITYTPRYSPPSMFVAEAVVGMLSDVGIRAKLNLMEYGQYTATVFQAKYPAGEMAFNPATLETPEASAYAFRPQARGAGTINRSRVNDPEFADLYDKFVAASDEAARRDLARQMQYMHVERVYKVFLPIPESNFLIHPQGRGFVFNGATGLPLVPGLENFWWAK